MIRSGKHGLVWWLAVATTAAAALLAFGGPAAADDDFSADPAGGIGLNLFTDWQPELQAGPTDLPPSPGIEWTSTDYRFDLTAPAADPDGSPLAGSPVPEPATAAFLSLGSIVLLFSVYRRRRHHR